MFLPFWMVFAVCLVAAADVRAQGGADFDRGMRPGEAPFEAELDSDPEERLDTGPAVPNSKPPLGTPKDAPRERFAVARSLGAVVDRIEFEGNRAIDSERLGRAASEFLGRRLFAEDFQQLLSAISRVYFDAGYVNSGAQLPEQRVDDGVLRIRIVEGRLGGIRISGLRHYKESVLRRRIRDGLGSPLRLTELEARLDRLRRDPRIERFDARLRPGLEPGDAVLDLSIEEDSPYRVSLGADNHAPPSVGTAAARIQLAHENLLGFGDRLAGDATFTEGLKQAAFRYALPIHSSGTRLEAAIQVSDAEVVQPPFDLIDVESESQSYSVGLRQPFFLDRRTELAVGVNLAYRRSLTQVLGRNFPFGLATDNGRTEMTVLRLSGDAVRRGRNLAVSFRTTMSFGLDLFSPTENPGSLPDGEFFAWLGQLRFVYRLPESGIEIHLDADLQLSDRSLLPLEQFAVGGPQTVRGYRRNLIVRDQGFLGSLEVRIPVWNDASRGGRVSLAPFVDVGRAWNRDRVTPRPRTLSSVGAAMRWWPIPSFRLEVQYAHRLRNLPPAFSGGDSLQERGLMLSATWSPL